MNYELLIQTGYVGLVLSIVSSVVVFVKLRIWSCVLQVTGIEHKRRVKALKNNKNWNKKKKGGGKLKTTELLVEEASELVDDTVVLDKIQKDEARDNDTIILTSEDLVIANDFVVTKDVVIVHTEETINSVY